jgi:glyoxylate reductase
MPTRKPTVIVTRKLPDVVETRMRELFATTLNDTDEPMSQSQLVDAVKKAEVLVPTVTDRIDKSVIMQAGDQLKLIANFGTGVDNIDVETATAKGITVTNTPGVLTEDTADMTMGLILAVSRRLIEGARVIGEDNVWQGWSPTWMLGRRISRASASASSAWAASVRPWRAGPRPSACRSITTTASRSARVEEQLEATYWDSLDQMLARMDIVSVNCPHTPGTFHLLSARRIS